MNSFEKMRSSIPLDRARRACHFSLATILLALLGLAPDSRSQELPQQSFEQATVAHLTLKSAVNQALQSSREVALARIQASVAERAAGVTRARFLPNLFTGSGAGYSSGIPQTPGGSAPSLFNMAYIQTVFNPPLRG
jgi:outer membrane protein TolC